MRMMDATTRGSPRGLVMWRQRAKARLARDDSIQFYHDLDDRSRLIAVVERPDGVCPAGLVGASELVRATLVSDRGGGDRAGQILLIVGFNVPTHAVGLFDDWYETEHSTLLLRAPQWLRVRRYSVRHGHGVDWTHIAIHDLESTAALDSPERAAAREGPKRQQFLADEWYQSSTRWIGERSRISDPTG